ncbi:cupin domain-containing protein [Pseudomonas taiwanensis]|uniref:cupin domain-containing protein n=1 Tax=Pseudomonas taiwanensis TaxID=470150 RepID=UPI0016486916|nr:cupin domain-containing protein [Pseudomonas taiwanensis]MBC3490702.1 cupin domain-containing protein [Pseudomonas taiwanensis]
MTTLDKLITLADVRGSMDLRCQFAGRWAIDHQPDELGTARYHIDLAGRCHLRLPDTSLIELNVGDIFWEWDFCHFSGLSPYPYRLEDSRISARPVADTESSGLSDQSFNHGLASVGCSVRL